MNPSATEKTKKTSPARWQADSALAFVALIWGTTFVVVKRALSDIGTLHFLALRFGLATACMLGMFFPALRKLSSQSVRGGLIGGAVAGVFLWLGYVLQTFGLKYTSAGKSGFLTGMYIVLVPLISAAVYRRWPQISELLGIAVAAAGVTVMTAPGAGMNFGMNRGDVLTLGCAVAFAVHLLLLGYFSQRESFEAVALGQIACAALLSAASLGWEGGTNAPTRGVVLAIVLTGVFATAVAFAIQTWGQQYTTATRTALIFALEPVFALATAVFSGEERLNYSGIAGGALILTGILAVELKPGRNG